MYLHVYVDKYTLTYIYIYICTYLLTCIYARRAVGRAVVIKNAY